MKTEHGYELANLAIAILVSVGLILFFEVKEEEIHWLIYAIATAPPLWVSIFWLTKVKVNEEETKIEYILPFRNPQVFKHEEIESYSVVKLGPKKDRPVIGFLKPINRKNAIMLSGKGTQDFEKLSDFLESIYPRDSDEKHNQSEQDNPITRP